MFDIISQTNFRTYTLSLWGTFSFRSILDTFLLFINDFTTLQVSVLFIVAEVPFLIGQPYQYHLVYDHCISVPTGTKMFGRVNGITKDPYNPSYCKVLLLYIYNTMCCFRVVVDVLIALGQLYQKRFTTVCKEMQKKCVTTSLVCSALLLF